MLVNRSNAQPCKSTHRVRRGIEFVEGNRRRECRLDEAAAELDRSLVELAEERDQQHTGDEWCDRGLDLLDDHPDSPLDEERDRFEH